MECFDFIYNAIQQPVFVIVKDTNYNYKLFKANKSALELIKYDLDEIDNISPIEIGLISNTNEWEAFEKLEPGETFKTISRIKDKNETYITSELSISRFKNDTEEFFVIFQRNMGSSQKILEALRQSEYRFLRMAESIIEGIIIQEANKIVFVNTAMQTITGYSKDELTEMKSEILARDDERERVLRFYDKVKEKQNGSLSIEYWIVTKKGDEKCIHQNLSFSIRPDGRKLTYIIITDVTERKNAEEDLVKSKAEFQMLAENSPDLITRYSTKLLYTYANNSANTILAEEGSSIIGKNNKFLPIDKKVSSFIEDMHLEAFRTGRSVKFEFRINNNNSIKVFQANIVPEISKGGKVDSVLNIARDITQIKNIEKNLLDEKQFLISESRLLAHNLELWYNNLEEKFTPEQYNALKPLNKISEWTQYRHLQQEYTPKPLVINDFLDNYYNNLKEKHGNTKIELAHKKTDFNIKVFADASFLKRLLDLLYENAIEATTEGKIEVGFDIYNNKEIVCSVKDTGCGIDPENADIVFEPFTTFNKDNHIGLGLSIADKLADIIGGQIWCLSAPETGSTFCFTIPADIKESDFNQSKDSKNWSDKKILVVEDTDNNFLLIETILRRMKPQLERCILGKDAIEKARNNSYDLILMDIQLPDINGYDVTKEIRTFNKDVPIIAQTAFAMYDNVVKALEVGCNDFIAKPIKSKKLIGMIEQFFNKK